MIRFENIPPFWVILLVALLLPATVIGNEGKKGDYAIQLAARPSLKEAIIEGERYVALGFQPVRIYTSRTGEETWYRIMVGRFHSAGLAALEGKRLTTVVGGAEFIVRNVEKSAPVHVLGESGHLLNQSGLRDSPTTTATSPDSSVAAPHLFVKRESRSRQWGPFLILLLPLPILFFGTLHLLKKNRKKFYDRPAPHP